MNTFKFILNNSPNLDQQDRKGQSALLVAAGSELIVNFTKVDFEDSTANDWIENNWTNEEAVRALIEKGVDVNLQDMEGKTALMSAAAWGGRGKIVRLLLENGAAIDVQDNLGNTALDYALELWTNKKRLFSNKSLKKLRVRESQAIRNWFKEWRNEVVVQLLLDNHIPIMSHSQDHLPTPLFKALQYIAFRKMFDNNTSDAQISIIERLANEETVGILDDNNQTALHFAAHSNSAQIFKIMLKHTVNVNCRDNWGETPLIKIVQNQHDGLNAENIPKLKMLLDRKPDLEVKNKPYGMTALMLAVVDPIPKKADAVAAVQELLDSGASVNVRDNKGATALWHTKDPNMTEILIKYGIAIDAQDLEGSTALISAVKTEQIEKVKELLKHGADARIADNLNTTALDHALDHENLTIFKTLLESDEGAPANVLYLLNQKRRKEEEILSIMDLLFKNREVELDATDKLGRTALMLVPKYMNKVLQRLLEQSPSIDHQDYQGKTALMYAAKNFRYQSGKDRTRLLLDHGASVTIAGNNGETALDIAKANQWNCGRACSEETDTFFGIE